jgi:hypothetical protein
MTVGLHECKSWYFTLEEEHKLQVSETEVFLKEIGK